MDITEVVLGSSRSLQRFCNTLYRHGREVVICQIDATVHQRSSTAMETSREVMSPSRVSELDRKDTRSVMERNIYSDVSPYSSYWNQRESLTLRNWLKENSKTRFSSLNRKSDLYVRQTGSENPVYLGTLVAVHAYSSAAVKHFLVVAPYVIQHRIAPVLLREICDFLQATLTGQDVYVLTMIQPGQFKLLEKWRSQ